ncbi:TPA: 16S rRNA pseudouridine(516) synthase, partial [Escherichia coli]|nr:16S rRNA pseudouridine(516) synthase [Escherichia coli]
GIMTEEDIRLFAEGLIIDGDEQTLPAKLQIDQVDQETETSIIRLILHEGKFHQVKRMVKAVGKEVLYLKRIRMGKFWLPKDLNKGQYRPMTKEELEQVREK